MLTSFVLRYIDVALSMDEESKAYLRRTPTSVTILKEMMNSFDHCRCAVIFSKKMALSDSFNRSRVVLRPGPSLRSSYCSQP